MNDEFWERVARSESNPTRLKILDTLAAASEPVSATTLAIAAAVTPDSINYHVNQLRKRGLVVLDRTEPMPGGQLRYFRLGGGVAV